MLFCSETIWSLVGVDVMTSLTDVISLFVNGDDVLIAEQPELNNKKTAKTIDI